MKKNHIIETDTLEFTFEGLPSVEVRVTDLSVGIQAKAMRHGLLAKIGDAAAIQKSADNGFIVTEGMRREAVEGMIAQLRAGDWNVKATARKAPQNATFLAIAAKRGCSYEEAEAYVAERMLAELSE